MSDGGNDDAQTEPWDLVPDDVDAPPVFPPDDPDEPRLPSGQSKFRAAIRRRLHGSDTLILMDGSGHEIGIRALADIAAHSDRPRDHGGFAAVESAIRSGDRVIYDDGRFWFWDHACGVWIDVPPAVVEKHINLYHGNNYGAPNARTGARKRIQMEISKTKSALAMAQIAVSHDDAFVNARPGLQFLDQFLYYDESDRCIRTMAPCAELYQRFQYPYPTPPADCLTWPVDDARFKELCPPLFHVLEGSIYGDVQDWRALQQRFGIALFGLSSRIRGSHLWFLGDKGTGKSTIAMAFASLFPPETRTGVRLHEVEEYRTWALRLSRINVVGEVKRIKRASVDYFKDATSDSLLPVRKAQGAELYIHPRFIQICASNEPPTIDADIDSVLDRFSIIAFKRFKGPPRTHLREEMEAHQYGLVAWALAGFYDWLANGLEPGSKSERIKKSWYENSDPVLQWASECLIPCQGEHVPLTTEAWNSFQQWCERTNTKNVGNRRDFGRRVRSVPLTCRNALHESIVCIIDHRVKKSITAASK